MVPLFGNERRQSKLHSASNGGRRSTRKTGSDPLISPDFSPIHRAKGRRSGAAGRRTGR